MRIVNKSFVLPKFQLASSNCLDRIIGCKTVCITVQATLDPLYTNIHLLRPYPQDLSKYTTTYIKDHLPTSLCWGVVLYSFLFFLMAGVRKAAESESLHMGLMSDWASVSALSASSAPSGNAVPVVAEVAITASGASAALAGPVLHYRREAYLNLGNM